MNKGWQCPVCGGGVAPTVERCPCVAQSIDGALTSTVGVYTTIDGLAQITKGKLHGDSPINIPEFLRTIPDSLREFVRPDNCWIEWRGGGCPVLDTALVSVRQRDGTELIERADRFEWAHRSGSRAFDIVAYKVLP